MRRAIAVRGIVQGVGFRPFVYRLACERGLRGFVKNQQGNVQIEVEGDAPDLDGFLADLVERAPPLAHVEEVTWAPCLPRGEPTFHIDTSDASAVGEVQIGPDVAPCADCLAELFDPADRRYRYPFLNCTNCGPRLTVIRAVPYDRERTSLAGFPLCPACQAEYDDPADRRFHAQPTACPACGPRLALLDADGRTMGEGDLVAQAAEALRQGKIVAVKGVGGYHLACNARNEAVVRELRRRKHRDEKPFALMVANLGVARSLCAVSAEEADLLQSVRRPIVLLRKGPGAESVAPSVAPGNPCLGLMLPSTPLHHLLLRELDPLPLVMTSGNRSDEPIAYEDGDALRRLAGIADLYLTHNRPIHVRCDDSVTRVLLDGAGELPLRRSRGQAPAPILLPVACTRPTLVVGGQLKNTFALGLGRHAQISHHLGDLDHYEAYRSFREAIDHYQNLFGIHPELIVHDLHPDYASTRYARERDGVRRLGVQHHHAHLAGCLAEHGLVGPALGVIFDGTGLGSDGAIWGGEFLVGGLRDFQRAGHLRYVPLPGGDQAVREPWRMALSHLLDAGEGPALLEGRVAPAALHGVGQLLARCLHAPPTSSAGRLFDAVAALTGVRDRVSYEGQAAVELEALAASVSPGGEYPFTLEQSGDGPVVIDTRPLMAAVAGEVRRGVPTPLIARRFHTTVVEMIVQVCQRLREATGLSLVVLSGGVFQNVLLVTEATRRLGDSGFRVLRPRQVPANDGGLCLGQLAIAAARVAD